MRSSSRKLYLRLAALVALAGIVVPVVLSRPSIAQSAAGEHAFAEPTEAAAPAAVAENHIPAKNLFSMLKAGGIVMIPIGCCSFVALVFAFERAIALRSGRVIPRPFVRRFMHKLHEGDLDRDGALLLCEESGSPVAGVFAHGVRKWGRPAVEVEQAVMDGGERAVNGLRKHVRVFNAVATISPLLGLQGTVFGMIRSFNDIATSQAMGRPELLAGGIGEALLTTAAGLTVAIPSLVVYLFFLGRIDRLIVEIDALGQELVSEISAEGLAENARPRAARVRREAA
ncbi:MAG: MotA/TolQ/ExbB proton channel family protein [Planctomycetia bacterium]|nr:MotA/TolQ/ExbB proton channel family protein [Planctomycetia bacterium]